MTLVVPEIESDPLTVVETIPEMEMVSQISGSVSFEVRLTVLLLESSLTIAESEVAVGAVFEQLIVTVPVAVLLSAPDPSATW